MDFDIDAAGWGAVVEPIVDVRARGKQQGQQEYRRKCETKWK
jgi:hypothetical protein